MTIDEQDQSGHSGSRDQGFDELVLMAERAGRMVRDQVAAIVDVAALQADEMQRRSEAVSRATTAEAREAAQRVLQLIRSLEREVEDLRRSASREADMLRGTLGKAVLSDSARELPPGAPQTGTETTASTRAVGTATDTSAAGNSDPEEEPDGDLSEPPAAEESRPRRSYWWRS